MIKEALKNRNIAILVMVVLIILGLILGTRVGINKEKNRIEEKYLSGNNVTDESVKKDVLSMAEEFREVAAKYIDTNNTAYTDYVESVEAFEKAIGLSKNYKALKEIGADAKTLKNKIDELTGETNETLTSKLGKLTSKISTLSGSVDAYNSAAETLNKKIAQFPCNLLSILGFVKKADVIG